MGTKRYLTRLPAIQVGSVLLESLIAVLIFFVGLIALVGISSQAIDLVGESKSRSDASYLADELIGELWTNTASIGTFESSAEFTNWQDRVRSLIGPAASATMTPNGNQLTIVISWPDKRSSSTSATHRYETTAVVAKNQ